MIYIYIYIYILLLLLLLVSNPSRQHSRRDIEEGEEVRRKEKAEKHGKVEVKRKCGFQLSLPIPHKETKGRHQAGTQWMIGHPTQRITQGASIVKG